MKKIVVCFKWLLDVADIRVNEATGTLDPDKAKWMLNEYDRNAIEAGVQIKNATGCELVGLTCGPKAQASCKDSLSRGLDSVTYIENPALEQADSGATAKTLAAAIKAMGDVDLVLCSEGSSDEYAQQTGGRLAALLGMSSVSCVSAIALDGESLTLDRKLEDGVERVQVTGSAVLSVVPDVNEAPIPSVKQILGAKKKPSNECELASVGLCEGDCAPQLTTLSVLAPKVDRKMVHLNPEGTSLEAAAAELVKKLVAESVL
ncbi:electron transfer flavoprotein subunit beta/FixA family protein [Desulfocurvus sp. DL9XJH121]